MYKKHGTFIEPERGETVIWRYMDFMKFVSMLDKQALFFTRADAFADHFEGVYPKANVKNPKRKQPLEPDSLNISSRELRKLMYINGWHVNKHESAAMWKLFLTSNEGVAIKSTLQQLKDSLAVSVRLGTRTYPVHIGLVSYIDYETEYIPEGNMFYPFLHKRKSFEHEHELRAVIFKKPAKPLAAPLQPRDNDHGLLIPANIDTLVTEIFVSPTAETWLPQLVDSVASRYGLHKKVTQSSLAESPLY